MLQAEGGEGILLDQLAAQGLHCDSGTQLVVVCEARLDSLISLVNWLPSGLGWTSDCICLHH